MLTLSEIIYASGLIYLFLFQVRFFIQQILEGLGHIHSLNILHLDIKVGFLVLSVFLTFPSDFSDVNGLFLWPPCSPTIS